MRTRVFGIVLCLTLGAAPLYAEDGYRIVHDVVYGHKAGMALTFDVVQPTENASGIGLLYMVSEGWRSVWFDLDPAIAGSMSRGGRFGTILKNGFTMFVVRHGSTPQFTAYDAVGDVRRATRYIRLHATEFGVDPERLGVFGNSAGGHLALTLGTTGDDGDPDSEDEIERTSSKVAAVVAYYPPVDLRNRARDDGPSAALSFDSGLAADVSPLVHVSADTPPTLLIHGDQDKVVPLSQSKDMLAALKDNGVPSALIVMEGAAHGFPGRYGSQAAEALSEWFKKYLSQ